MLEIIYDRCLGVPSFNINGDEFQPIYLRQLIESHMQLHFHGSSSIDFYAICNGKKVDVNNVSDGIIHVIPRLSGGKGGFGSMLRAIGAQIEKTTNREACRDLSGRRLRDINEEKRLKKWIAEQAEREREAAERKKRKLSKLCVEPKHEFCDPDYDKARSEMTDKVHDAVEEGLKTVNSLPESSASNDRDINKKKNGKRIKGDIWLDELEELDSDELDESGDEAESPKKKLKVE